ncbi:replication factor C subunit 3/5 [Nematocida sp. AWRm77]|nr:replication factor C subunit 3/5 [Nematocida sp. AWRm77]
MFQEKYRPSTLEEIEGVQCSRLLRGFDMESFPNIIFVGQEGAGKRTLFRAFVKHLFGKESAYSGHTMAIETSSSKTVDVDILESNECLEVRIEGYGQSDKKILQRLAKDISETKSIQGFFSGAQKNSTKTKLLVVSDGEYITQGAQMALRRIMEQGAGNFRLVILTTSTSPFIDAFKSRFLVCRVPAKTDAQIEAVLTNVLAKEEKTLQRSAVLEIVEVSKGNLRKALSLLELSLCTDAPALVMGWEKALQRLSKTVRNSPSIGELVSARKTLYDMLESPVPGKEILSAVLRNLLASEASVERAKRLSEYAALFDARLSRGTKELFHIEAFVARAMSIYSNSK